MRLIKTHENKKQVFMRLFLRIEIVDSVTLGNT